MLILANMLRLWQHAYFLKLPIFFYFGTQHSVLSIIPADFRFGKETREGSQKRDPKRRCRIEVKLIFVAL